MRELQGLGVAVVGVPGVYKLPGPSKGDRNNLDFATDVKQEENTTCFLGLFALHKYALRGFYISTFTQ